jgi:hypothetical protein
MCPDACNRRRFVHSCIDRGQRLTGAKSGTSPEEFHDEQLVRLSSH